MWKVYSMTANPFQGRLLSNSCAASAAIAAGPGRSSTSASCASRLFLDAKHGMPRRRFAFNAFYG
jgi:hypothetical protein